MRTPALLHSRSTSKLFKKISKLGLGLAATTQEGDDNAQRRDPTGPEEDNK